MLPELPKEKPVPAGVDDEAPNEKAGAAALGSEVDCPKLKAGAGEAGWDVLAPKVEEVDPKEKAGTDVGAWLPKAG